MPMDFLDRLETQVYPVLLVCLVRLVLREGLVLPDCLDYRGHKVHKAAVETLDQLDRLVTLEILELWGWRASEVYRACLEPLERLDSLVIRDSPETRVPKAQVGLLVLQVCGWNIDVADVSTID